ncbi:FHA domain protein [Enhygromyxa salina]|uniref:FHA domain protein n=1 Tax=Enhygromyxa salina TaxID=215803 RepID=A0A2S9XCX0_9BACT|nr:FHA domain protein [Enhygromyxa salina]
MRLIIEDLEGSTTVVNLGNEEVTIGRKPHNTIQLTEQNVSRSHAKLIFQDDGWLIHDLGSYNGIKVNGVEISEPTLLRESDLIQIGDYHLTLTDNVDRQTLDIQRPRAANDGLVAMASSSDLPSMSVEDLEPMRAPAGAAAAAPGAQGYEPAPDEEEKPSKVGLIIGIVGALAAVVGIAIFLASNAGGDDDDTKEVAADDGKQEPVAKEAPKKDAGGTEVVPEVLPEPGDTGEAPAADEGVAPSDDDDGGEIVAEIDEPKPKPKPKPSNQPKPKPKPKLPPEQALAAARKASLQGDNRKAYNLAKDAYDQNKSGDALNLMGVAACKMGSASKAKSAYRKMTSKDKGTLEKICGPLGIEL